MNKSSIWWLCLFVICMPGLARNALCHGVRSKVDSGQGIIVQSEYDDGEPMTYSHTEIFAPGETRPFQTGVTDRNGQFLFCPDMTGTWKVAVNDGMGHALSRRIEIKEDMRVVQEDVRRFPRFQGVIVGVSIIFGLFGLISFFPRWKHSA